jgi:hypothetical protein
MVGSASIWAGRSRGGAGFSNSKYLLRASFDRLKHAAVSFDHYGASGSSHCLVTQYCGMLA